MQTRRHVLFSKWVLSFVLALVAVTANAKPPQWISPTLALTWDAGKPSSYDLNGYLQNPGDGITFTNPPDHSNPPMPSWITLTGSVLSATPTNAQAGEYLFTILAQNGTDSGAPVTVDLKVQGVANCNAQHLDFSSPENVTFSKNDLAKFCTDPNGGPLSYSLHDTKPSWVGFDTGSATFSWASLWDPQHDKVGTVTVNIDVKTTSGGVVTVPVNITITRFFKAAAWNVNPIKLGLAFDDGTLFSADLAQFVTVYETIDDPKPTYAIANGPAWLSIDPSGNGSTISGTPQPSDVTGQPTSVPVVLTSIDPKNGNQSYPANDTVTLTVTHRPEKPTCNVTAIDLGNTPLGPYSHDFNGICKVTGSDTMQYSLSGPTWASITPSAASPSLMSGTALFANLGANSWTLTVSNAANTSLSVTLPVTLNVTKTPVTWKDHAISLSPPDAKENITFNADLSLHVNNPDGKYQGPFQCKQVEPSDWITVTKDCQVSGTPKAVDIGTQTFTVQVSDGITAADTTTVTVIVDGNHAPTCLDASTTMKPNAKERSLYSNNTTLPSVATDPTYQSQLKYSLVSGPGWIKVAADGTVTGTPVRADVTSDLNPPETFVVQVTNPINQSCNATLHITVDKDPRPPKCTSFSMDVTARVPISGFTLANNATDLDGETLTFSKPTETPAQPDWLATDPTGLLSGTPPDLAVAQQTMTQQFTFRATNADNMSCDIPTTSIDHFNAHPPVPHNDQMVFTVKERANDTYNLADPSLPHPGTPYISNPDGAALTCVQKDTLGFVNLSSDCKLTLSPKRSDISATPYTYRFTVAANGGTPVSAIATITVVKDPRPPKCTDIALTAQARVLFNGSVKGGATDLDGETLAFALKSTTPNWLTTDAQGNVTGTPSDTDQAASPETFVFTATNSDNLSCDFNVAMTIQFSPHPPVPHNDRMVFTVKERTVTTYALADQTQPSPTAPYISNPDLGPLTCTPISSVGFVKLNSDCSLTLSPQRKDVGGPIPFSFTVSSANFPNIPATATITVLKDPRPPQCKDATMTAAARKAFTGTLVGDATDLDGEALTFTKKVATPAWLATDASGNLTGTPSDDDQKVSPETFTFTATNQDSLSCDIHVSMNIQFTPHDITPNNDLMAFQVKERATLTVPLADPNQPSSDKPYITNPDHVTLSCVAGPDKPSFVTLGSDCSLTMAPVHKDVRDQPYPFHFTINGGPNPATGIASITVLRDAQPPVWNPKSYTFLAQAGQLFSGTVTATDPDSYPLTYVLNNCPAWMKVSGTGTITGTPAESDVAVSTCSVTANNGYVTADASIKMKVVLLKWTANPVVLPSANIGTVYPAQALGGYVVVKDPENPSDPITFARLAPTPAAWALVSSSGSVTGTPGATDVGAGPFPVRVTDGNNLHADSTVSIPVATQPPTISAITFTVKERESVTKLLNDPQYIQTTNTPDTLTCALVDSRTHNKALDWLKMAPDCSLTMTPVHKDLGDYTVTFAVTNAYKQTTQGTITIHVIRSPQKPVCNDVAFDATAGTLFSDTVATACKDLDGWVLNYAAPQAPAWMVFNSAGNMLGTPQETDVGKVVFQATATNDDPTLATSFNVTINVKTSIVPPICDNPIRLPDAPVGKTYIQSIASHCHDPLGGTLTFSEISNLDWVNFSTSGAVLGNPKTGDIRDHSYDVKVANAKGSVTVQVLIKVVPPAPLSWKQDPINLGQQVVGQSWTFDLNPYIINPSGAAYTCTKAADKPVWIQVSADCHAFGTPQLTDLGQYVTAFAVSNGGDPVKVGAYGEVIKVDIQVKPMDFTVMEGTTKSFDLTSYVTVPQGDSVTYSCADCEPWATVTSSGSLNLSPKHPQLGDHTFHLTVTDPRNVTAQGPMVIHVTPNENGKPDCASPQTFTAHVGQSFQGSIVCNDPSGSGLTYSKMWDNDSPIWMTVSSVGTMSGTPGAPNAGADQYLVTVKNGNGQSMDVTVVINVLADSPNNDVVVVDEKYPWATPIAENLWVLDSVGKCGRQSKLIKNFKSSMHVYFDDLDTAHVEHTGVYIAANQTKVDGTKSLTGQPVPDDKGSNVLSWNESDLVGDFQDRIDKYDGCPCYVSPVWSEFLFYTKYLTGMSEYGKTWFQPKVPMDTIIVTEHQDYFQHYAENTSQAGWPVGKYVSDVFAPPHASASKPYRINIIAPKCLEPNDGRTATSATDDEGNLHAEPVHSQEPTYKALKDLTGGTYQELDTCNASDISDALTVLADQVKFRALVVSKYAIPLSKKPSDPSQIQVFLGGQQLPNTLWQYDPVKNVINIFWDKVDLTTVKPGDKIEIKYNA